MEQIQGSLLKTALIKQPKNLNLKSDVSNHQFNKELEKVAEDIESIFIHQILKESRKNHLSDDGLFPQSHAMDIYKDMMDEKIANTMSKNNSLGLAEYIKNNLKRS